MISPEQLAAALERLDPRDRELLALSLRRRVPDDALARMYDVGPSEVARRRAGAIERLADELAIKRGEDLGNVLTALLEEEIWSATGAPRPGDEFSSSRREAGPVAVPDPVDVPEAPVKPAAHEPAPEIVPREAPAPPPSPKRRVPTLAVALFGFGLAALLGAVAIAGLTQLGGDGQASVSDSGTGDGTRYFVPERTGPMAAPFPSEPQSASCYSTAFVRRPVTLRRRPAGKRLMRVAAKTEWNSPRVFGVVRRQGDWVAVQAPELDNGEIGWISTRSARLDCTTWSLHADLSKRKIFVRKEGKTVRSLDVAIGRPGNGTPKGRFSITDKLRVTDAGSPYGCCVLALTGHQTNLPPDWPGGDRLAVHATKDLASIGQAASLGCLRAGPDQMRWLIKTLPLGAPVFVRS